MFLDFFVLLSMSNMYLKISFNRRKVNRSVKRSLRLGNIYVNPSLTTAFCRLLGPRSFSCSI